MTLLWKFLSLNLQINLFFFFRVDSWKWNYWVKANFFEAFDRSTTIPSWEKKFFTRIHSPTHIYTCHTLPLSELRRLFPGWEAGHRCDDPSMKFPSALKCSFKIARSPTIMPPSLVHPHHSPPALKNRSWNRGWAKHRSLCLWSEKRGVRGSGWRGVGEGITRLI